MLMIMIIRGHIATVKAYFGKPCLTWDSFSNFSDVSPFIMTHLKQVYLSLFLILLSSVLGSVWHFFTKNGGLTNVIGFMGFLIWYNHIQPWRGRKRVSLLMAAAFCKGVFLEFLLGPFIHDNKGIIITLLGGSALAFGCFAVVARRYERERDYTYSYGVLYAIIIVSIWLFSGSYMYGGKDAYTLYFFVPFVGLSYLLSYTVLYSQEIVEQTRRDDHHYSEHCVMFFTYIPALSWWFVSNLLKELHTFITNI
ncbi:hypothetical protein M9H77_33522 [Catharanthus roseus]|uniref:Uncharacterized protein n=1 Tax=Catharanthus roseus TaxID=4058 RepID=A0ACB9ZKS9_CATRO|nr:hypothetical protein M9H77_33522 [Catharanthus roseus]